MSGKHANGEGSVYQPASGVWIGAAFVDTTDGRRKRIFVRGATRQSAREALNAKIALSRRGIRAPVKTWTVAAYLDYWLKNVVAVKNRPRTRELYEQTIRLYLKPALGRIQLTKLSVQDVQRMVNGQVEGGYGARTIQKNRGVLRAALSRAEREELVARNVAKLVDIPAYHRKPITPWTAQQVTQFLATARDHRWFGAYVFLVTYGLRRGEVLGLRWRDIDLDAGRLTVAAQLQRVGSDLHAVEVKTEAGHRVLPTIPLIRAVLLEQKALQSEGPAPDLPDELSDLVFRSSTGTPIDPKNFVRDFHQLREKAGLPRITVHHTRHTAATLLKNLGVPARDAQLILGHAHVTTTQQIYQHADIDGQTRALERVGQLLTGDVAAPVAAFAELSTGQGAEIGALTSGGPGGARTLDTLLKRHFSTPVENLLTPVICHVRARTRTYVLGWVAAQRCCSSGNRAHLADALEILRDARSQPGRSLHLSCYPYTLLPTDTTAR
jgi:integrase